MKALRNWLALVLLRLQVEYAVCCAEAELQLIRQMTTELSASKRGLRRSTARARALHRRFMRRARGDYL